MYEKNGMGGHGNGSPVINHPEVEPQQAQHGQSVGKTLHVTFRLNKHTDNTVQYKEVGNGPRKVGTLYIQKWLMVQPYPDMISVDIHLPLGVDLAGQS